MNFRCEVNTEFNEEISNSMDTENPSNEELIHENYENMSSKVEREVKPRNEEHEEAVKEVFVDNIKKEMVESYEECEYFPESAENDVKPNTVDTQFHADDSIGHEHRNKRARNECFQAEELSTSQELQIKSNRILKCTKCTFIATKSASMDQHQVVHFTKKPFRCTQCQYDTSVVVNFNHHIRAHNADKPNICEHCGFGFNKTSHMRRHIKCRHQHIVNYLHSLYPNPILKCYKCEFSTTISIEMKRHKEQFHTIDHVLLKCLKCNFMATKSSSIELHDIIHTTKSPYSCINCEYKTEHTGHFNYHLLSYNNDKPFICPECDRGFTQRQHLKQHMRSQHPDDM